MKKKLLVVLGAIALVLIGAVAYASIPGPDGVIHGCYKTANPAQGALITIDSAANCPSGYTALNWNQTGPQGSQGPAGVSGYELVSVDQIIVNNSQTNNLHVDCPAGKHPISGVAALSTDVPFNSGRQYVNVDTPGTLTDTTYQVTVVLGSVINNATARATAVCAFTS